MDFTSPTLTALPPDFWRHTHTPKKQKSEIDRGKMKDNGAEMILQGILLGFLWFDEAQREWVERERSWYENERE